MRRKLRRPGPCWPGRHPWSVAKAGRSTADVNEEVFDRRGAGQRYERHAEFLDRLPRAGDTEEIGCVSLQRRLGPFFDGGPDGIPRRAGREVAAEPRLVDVVERESRKDTLTASELP